MNSTREKENKRISSCVLKSPANSAWIHFDTLLSVDWFNLMFQLLAEF